jgi:hypothetical protein|uniref:Uncharacterized protein n=1 Tax=Picea glauca TaxID=3330 RepID=A0A101LU54_PICGL|nr:hypothetical protein ABT39_MTgene2683 [Picea glauca]
MVDYRAGAATQQPQRIMLARIRKTIIKEALDEEICPIRHLEFFIHNSIMEICKEPKIFDPLGIKIGTKQASFAVMIGAIIAALYAKA